MRKFLILLLFLITSLFADKNVLILHSYHHGLEWTDDISNGIIDTFDTSKEKVNLYFEYLDGKRNTSATFLEETYNYFKIKHKNSRFDLIMVSDNKALMFMN